MPGAAPTADHSACSGCRLCVLVCPVWRETYDLRMTPKGRAKALQHGAGIDDIAESVEACTLCGACEPACPEHIALVPMVESLRRQLPRTPPLLEIQARINAWSAQPPPQSHPHPDPPPRTGPASSAGLVPCRALRADPSLLARVAELVRASVCEDAGEDLAMAIESGAVVPPARLERFLAPLRGLKQVIIADGLLFRHLRAWLPKTKIESLGEAFSRLPSVRMNLLASDLYVIEPRAFHADYDRLVKHYDRLRVERGCAMNLDLQRIAIPATARNLRQRLGVEAADDAAQTRWLLQGRKIARIVVESADDAAAFRQVGNVPVVHLAELANE